MQLPLFLASLFWLFGFSNSLLAQQQWQQLEQFTYQDTNSIHSNNQQLQVIQRGKALFKSSIEYKKSPLKNCRLQWLTWEAGQWQEQQTLLLKNIAPKEQVQSLLSEDGQYWVSLKTAIVEEKENKQLCIQLQRLERTGSVWSLKATQKDTLTFVEWLEPSIFYHSTLQLSKDGKVALLYHNIKINEEKNILQTYHWETNQWIKKLELEEVHQPQLSTNGQTIALLKIEDHETIRESWVVTYYQQEDHWQQVQQLLDNTQGMGYSYEYFHYTGYNRSLKLSGDGKTLGITYFPGQGEAALPQLNLYQLVRVGDKAYWFPKGKLPAPALQPPSEPWSYSRRDVQTQWKGDFDFSEDGNQLAFIQVIDSFQKKVAVQQLLCYHWQGNAWKLFRKPLEWPIAVYDKRYHGENRDQCQVYFEEEQLRLHNHHTVWVLDTITNKKMAYKGNTVSTYAWEAPPSYSKLTLTVCQEYRTSTGQLITTSGIYQDTLINYQGGDSILTLDLTLIKIDTDLYTLDHLLLSLDTTAQIQWIDCQNTRQPPDSEPTQQHYFIPPKTGNYRAQLSKQGCVLSSKTVFYQKE